MNLRTKSRTILVAALAAASLTVGVGTAQAAEASELDIVANGCDFTFTTINGQGAADGWSATFTVDGNDAGNWGSANDVEVLTNWISREFTPGGTLTVVWEVFALPGNATIATGTTVLTVPACDLPYQIRVNKVVTGQVPADGFTVDVWSADEDGGPSCASAPANGTQTLNLPAAGGAADARVTPGNWCVLETERRGALTTTYASNGGSMLGDAHLVSVPPAPGTLTVTITNTFPASSGPVPPPALPSTGSSTTFLALLAGLLVAAGMVAQRLARPTP